ncbi:hypothetical protein GCM10009529_27620 [Micropruina glycogenica]
MASRWWVGPAGRLRRLVYPQADRMRAEIAELRKANAKLNTRVAELSADLDAVKAEFEKLHTWRTQLHADMDAADRDRIELVRPYTMTSMDKLTSLTLAVRYIVQSGIDGDFMECGVWKDGPRSGRRGGHRPRHLSVRHLCRYDRTNGKRRGFGGREREGAHAEVEQEGQDLGHFAP